MKDTLYVIVNRRGIDRTCKTGSFTLKSNERAFELKVEIPDEAFASPPVPVVRMMVPAESLIREITVGVEEGATPEAPDA